MDMDDEKLQEALDAEELREIVQEPADVKEEAEDVQHGGLQDED
jgi:hypothetical protein